jgi:phosphopentomutase
MSGADAVGRVIARPFAGEQGSFVRTEGRRDLAIAPPGRSYLQELEQAGVEVMAVGKVDDLFASRGITTAHPGSNNAQALASVERLLAEGRRGLIFANLIETDQLYGHRKDTAGFHAALRRIDQALGRIRATLGPGDLLIVTADHGVDLAHPGTDHTREYVPLLALTGEMERARAAGGTRGGVGHDGPMADVGASAFAWLAGRQAEGLPGRSFIS